MLKGKTVKLGLCGFILFFAKVSQPADFTIESIDYEDFHQPQYKRHTDSHSVLHTLRQAEKAVQFGNYSMAVQTVHETILDKPDALVKTKDGWVSSQLMARRFFRRLPFSVQRNFFSETDGIYGIEARKRLQQAVERADQKAILVIAEKYPSTPAGLEARFLLATSHYNRGNVVLALNHLDVLLEDEKWISSADSGILTFGAFLATIAGQEEKLHFFLKQLEDRGITNLRIGGHSCQFQKFKQFLLSQAKHPDPATSEFLSSSLPSGEIFISTKNIRYQSPVKMPDGTLTIDTEALPSQIDSHSLWPRNKNDRLMHNGNRIEHHSLSNQLGKAIIFGPAQEILLKANALATANTEVGIAQKPMSLSGGRVVFGRNDSSIVYLQMNSENLNEVGQCKLPVTPNQIAVMGNGNLVTWDCETLVLVKFGSSNPLANEKLGPSVQAVAPLKADKDLLVIYSTTNIEEKITWLRATEEGKISIEAVMNVQGGRNFSEGPAVLPDDSVIFIATDNIKEHK
ncbi:MAG: hypothetical protein HY537_13585, partial [Deltaproteobacteria bacterium]|nr:hypothetical protein [Deltaproteobacteria bacterium]